MKWLRRIEGLALYNRIITQGAIMRPPLWSSGQRSWLLNGDALCFREVRTEFIHRICYLEESRPPLRPLFLLAR
jgi:hypothetical protein